jgi:hypothetical protein
MRPPLDTVTNPEDVVVTPFARPPLMMTRLPPEQTEVLFAVPETTTLPPEETTSPEEVCP